MYDDEIFDIYFAGTKSLAIYTSEVPVVVYRPKKEETETTETTSEDDAAVTKQDPEADTTNDAVGNSEGLVSSDDDSSDEDLPPGLRRNVTFNPNAQVVNLEGSVRSANDSDLVHYQTDSEEEESDLDDLFLGTEPQEHED